jgi:hypothetical protein
MTNSPDNMALWQAVCTTDPRAVKPITGKQYSGNSPKPYWLIQRATEVFGPVGIGWGVTVKSERFERLSDTDVLHVAVVAVWYVLDGKRSESFEQMGGTKAAYKTAKGTVLVDEDAGKKSVTDGMVKCLSMIGFAGDIFSGMWDDSKYVAWAAEQYAGASPRKPDVSHSGPQIILAELSEDWQVWLTEFARDVQNTFASTGPAAAAQLIEEVKEREQLGPEHITGLWAQLDSKCRSALKALPRAANQVAA